jgi:hypothetical protein
VSGIHAIGLGDAWEVEADPAGEPAAWLRRFGRPTGLTDDDAVWLVIDAAEACAITLNGAALPAITTSAACRVEVTRMLGDRNRLRLVPLAGGAARPGRGPLPAAIGRVRLEIVTGGGDRERPATRHQAPVKP